MVTDHPHPHLNPSSDGRGTESRSVETPSKYEVSSGLPSPTSVGGVLRRAFEWDRTEEGETEGKGWE